MLLFIEIFLINYKQEKLIFWSTIFRLIDFILGLLVGSPILGSSLTVVGYDWQIIFPFSGWISHSLIIIAIFGGRVYLNRNKDILLSLFPLLDFLTVVVVVVSLLIWYWLCTELFSEYLPKLSLASGQSKKGRTSWHSRYLLRVFLSCLSRYLRRGKCRNLTGGQICLTLQH